MKNTNKKYADIATIRNTAARCREEGIPVGGKDPAPLGRGAEAPCRPHRA